MNRESPVPGKASSLLRLLKQKRAFLKSDVPAYGSVIGLEIFLVLCEADVRGSFPRLKDLNVEISRSPGAVRRIVRAMAEDGWIELRKADHDHRTRVVVPAPRLRRTIAGYLASLGDA